MGKKDNLLSILLGTGLRSLSSNRAKNKNNYLLFESRMRIPIIFNTINVTHTSTQTLPMNINNNNSKNNGSNLNQISFSLFS